VRGYRVEPSEIEAVLLEQHTVQQVRVTNVESQNTSKLVAYVVIVHGFTLDSQMLRRALLAKLPDYMIPQVFVAVNELPLTASGKLDRNALPIPSTDQTQMAEALAPRDNLEIFLKQLWEEVLGLSDIGIRDNFFDLGGHSIIAVALSARLLSYFGDKVSVRTIFERPTIEEMAALLRQEVSFSPPSYCVPIQPRGSRRPLFCMPIGGGLVDCYIELARQLGRDQPVYGLQSREVDGGSILLRIEDMAALYVEAIRQQQPSGPYQIAGLSIGGVIAYEVARQLRFAGEDVSLLALLDTFFTHSSANQPLTDEEMRERVRESMIPAAVRLLHIDREEIADLDLDEVLRVFLARAKEQSILPSDITLDQLERLALVSATHSLANESYNVPPYDGHVVLLNAESMFPEHRGLNGLARTISVCRIPGTHSEVLKKPHVGAISRALSQLLASD
jgi:thioesterase domain-containing protein/aryl carrier-like protein